MQWISMKWCMISLWKCLRGGPNSDPTRHGKHQEITYCSATYLARQILPAISLLYYSLEVICAKQFMPWISQSDSYSPPHENSAPEMLIPTPKAPYILLILLWGQTTPTLDYWYGSYKSLLGMWGFSQVHGYACRELPQHIHHINDSSQYHSDLFASVDWEVIE